MTAHAKLGASSASRWMNCLGSPRMIQALPPAERERSSIYAEEGTAAHALAALCLGNGRAPETYEGSLLVQREHDGDYDLLEMEADADGVTRCSGLGVNPPLTFQVGEEMVSGVRVYLEAVAAERRRLPNAEMFVEQRVYPLAGEEADIFGTADCILWDPVESEVVVIDFKYGAGVVVEADFNSQTMIYGLGGVRLVAGEEGARSVQKARLVIVQPRARHADGPVRPFELSGRELVEWGGTLRSAVAATREELAPLRAGDWCRWCPALATCPEMRRAVTERARVAFDEPAPPDDEDLERRLHLMLPDPAEPEQLAAALDFVPLLEAWCREVETLGLERAKRGGRIPGFKLVRKRSIRRWIDEEAVEKRLRQKRGVRVDDIFDRKLRSPAQLEKIKAIGKAWVEQHCEKPEGSLTLAPETDPRPEVAPPVLTAFVEPVTPDVTDATDPATTGEDWLRI